MRRWGILANVRLAKHPELAPVLGGAVLLMLSTLLHLRNSLWIDETITAWIVRDGLWDVVVRATEFQGQSPFYFIGPWAASKILGFHEWALRLPSLAANLGTVVALFFFFKNLAGKDVAGYGAGIFAVTASCSSQLQAARPYALAICCLSVSLLFFLKWILSGSRSMMICFALSMASVIYSHYLFVLCLPCFGFLLFHFRGHSRISLTHVVAAAALCCVVALPAGWQLYLLGTKASLYSFSAGPSFTSWAYTTSVHVSTLVAISVLTMGYVLRRSLITKKLQEQQGLLFLAISLWMYPSIALVVASLAANCPVLVPRYALYSVIGESLLVGLFLCFIPNTRLRSLLFFGAATLSIAVTPHKIFFGEDWRAALNNIPKSSAEPSMVLLWTGVVETKNLEWAHAPHKREYLLSPLTMYPVGSSATILPLYPHLTSPQSVFSSEDKDLLEKAKRIFVVIRTHAPFAGTFTDNNPIDQSPWLGSKETLIARSLSHYHGIMVVEIERSTPGRDYNSSSVTTSLAERGDAPNDSIENAISPVAVAR